MLSDVHTADYLHRIHNHNFTVVQVGGALGCGGGCGAGQRGRRAAWGWEVLGGVALLRRQVEGQLGYRRRLRPPPPLLLCPHLLHTTASSDLPPSPLCLVQRSCCLLYVSGIW
mgnify:CR=1 FL=1